MGGGVRQNPSFRLILQSNCPRCGGMGSGAKLFVQILVTSNICPRNLVPKLPFF
jgi:hypothetical protein